MALVPALALPPLAIGGGCVLLRLGQRVAHEDAAHGMLLCYLCQHQASVVRCKLGQRRFLLEPIPHM